MNEREQSEFNMAVSHLNLLNTLLWTAAQARMSLDIDLLNQSLIQIYVVLSTEMKKDELVDIKKTFSSISERVALIKARNIRSGRLDIPMEIYFEMMELEMRLRKIAKDAGLLMKIKDDASKALR